MDRYDKIEQYDLVEVTRVPAEYVDVMDPGDIGVVVEKQNDENFVVECIQPGGLSKWIKPLHIRYIRLKSRDPYGAWMQRSLMQKSVPLGLVIGAVTGVLTGGGLGATTKSLPGFLIGMVIGIVLGGVTGALTAALTVKTAGTTGGVGVGYYTGMLVGGVLGLLTGVLIPTSWWMRAQTEGLPVLDALARGRFETAVMMAFFLSILATIVGVWIGGRNFVPRDTKSNE